MKALEVALTFAGRLVFNKLKSRPEHFVVKGLVRQATINSTCTPMQAQAAAMLQQPAFERYASRVSL